MLEDPLVSNARCRGSTPSYLHFPFGTLPDDNFPTSIRLLLRRSHSLCLPTSTGYTPARGGSASPVIDHIRMFVLNQIVLILVLVIGFPSLSECGDAEREGR
jgi:hypothetical protein